MTFYLISFLLGFLIGTFLNSCIYRISRCMPIVIPWSKKFKKDLSTKDYPAISLINLVTGFIFFLLAFQHGLSITFLFSIIFFAVLIIIVFVDIERQLIFDHLILTLFVITLAKQTITPQITLTSAIYGSLIGFSVLLALAIIANGAFGGGDIKLMIPLGFYFGSMHVSLLLLLAFILSGLVSAILLILKIKKRRDFIPFGPFLGIAALIVTLIAERIIL